MGLLKTEHFAFVKRLLPQENDLTFERMANDCEKLSKAQRSSQCSNG